MQEVFDRIPSLALLFSGLIYNKVKKYLTMHMVYRAQWQTHLNGASWAHSNHFHGEVQTVRGIALEAESRFEGVHFLFQRTKKPRLDLW